jgi:anti-anti-sigma factor
VSAQVGRAHLDVDAHQAQVRAVVSGEVDLANAAEVQHRLFAEIPNWATLVQVDLTGVRYLDSAGLAVLFRLADRLRVGQTELQVLAPSGSPARSAIEVTGMAQLCGLAEG